MKTRFNSYDIVCGITELQTLVGLRVNQVYDVDNKTYLIRLQGGVDSKKILLIESGIRFHTTSFEWPKNVAPSGFSMKMRKHLRNKRVEKIQQLGVDRIVDFQFGSGEAAHHVILELYDRGNIILTDHELTILYVLRPHYEGEKIRFAVREKYPEKRAKEQQQDLTKEKLQAMLSTAPLGENIRRFLMPIMDCGPAVIDHVLLLHKLHSTVISLKGEENRDGGLNAAGDVNKSEKLKGKRKHAKTEHINGQLFDVDKDMPALMKAIQEANHMLREARTSVSKGCIIQKKEENTFFQDEEQKYFYQNIEFHPYHFLQFADEPVLEFDSFMSAVDEFYSKLEAQKIDLKTLQQERDVLKKLSNVKKDHARRLEDLINLQNIDKQKADLITCNRELVDNAILAIRSAVAIQMSWPDIQDLLKAAQQNGDPVASAIKSLKLEINHISLKLSDVYNSTEMIESSKNDIISLIVDVDLALSAWANARKYYDQKRMAAQKEQKTIDASEKALKSAEKKTQQTLKDVRTISTICKARKVFWFEKFYWFISSENYLIIGGRDAQQNELIVKRYMRPTDIYVHAEIQGASSVVIRNSSEKEVPPKTLLEAGTMAISYSFAWDAKVVTNAYWVYSNQVSKKAPTGEYLGTGSFMIRGKKNFLPSCHLIMGLSFLFKLEDSFIEKHKGERKIRIFEEEQEISDVTPKKLNALITENKDLRAERVREDSNNKNIGAEIMEPKAIVSDNQDVITSRLKDEKHMSFPDIEVKIEHDTGRVTVRNDLVTDPTSDTNAVEYLINSENIEETTLIPAAPSHKKKQQNARNRKEQKARENNVASKERQAQNQTPSSLQVKRGQKGKLKKIKNKYKDQDEDERKLRMQVLNSSRKEYTQQESANETVILCKTYKTQAPIEPREDQNDEEQNEGEEMLAAADMEILDSLTGQPLEDDELLFAVPVVAPYQSLQNYKYKVKLTPGTGKRGRAVKTALNIFLKDKACGAREKALLKGVKEELLARNIPGKVKISAPQLQKIKK